MTHHKATLQKQRKENNSVLAKKERKHSLDQDSKPEKMQLTALQNWHRQRETQTIYTQSNGERVNTIRARKTNQTGDGNTREEQTG